MRKHLSKKLFLFLLLLILAFNFQDNVFYGWQKQITPDLGGRNLADVFFLDSLNGWALTEGTGDTSYVIKTTNSGDNWSIVFRIKRNFTKVIFINDNTGFLSGGSGGGTAYLYKSTDSGLNWFVVSSPAATMWDGISVRSNDTIFVIDSEPLTGGVYKTINGGVNWVRQLQLGNLNPTKIYFYNSNTGYISKTTGSPYIRKTTNGGTNWNLITSGDGFLDMAFTDSMTGWKANVDVKKTTDGGLNWISQSLPSVNGMSIWGMIKIALVNKDTIWGVGNTINFPGYGSRAFLYKTTNGGVNWGYQIADTSFGFFRFYHLQFLNKRIGWAYSVGSGIHTTVGGDTTFLTNINNSNSQISNNFILNQNYPNPFNPNTVISYQLSVAGFISLKVYDLNGREITTLINKKQSAGSYSVEFNASNLSSGIYFYTLQTDKFTDTKKMILVK